MSKQRECWLSRLHFDWIELFRVFGNLENSETAIKTTSQASIWVQCAMLSKNRALKAVTRMLELRSLSKAPSNTPSSFESYLERYKWSHWPLYHINPWLWVLFWPENSAYMGLFEFFGHLKSRINVLYRRAGPITPLQVQFKSWTCIRRYFWERSQHESYALQLLQSPHFSRA